MRGSGLVDELGPDDRAYDGILRFYGGPISASGIERFLCRVADVQDGLSQTAIISEAGGRPYLAGRRGIVPGSTNLGEWGFDNAYVLRGLPYDWPALNSPDYSCAVNCSNGLGPYSFHPGGAAFLFADGAAAFVAQNIDLRIVARLLTRSGGEVISAESY